MELTEHTIKSEKVYKGHIVDVRVDSVTLPNGKTSGREVVEHPGGVVIFALDANNEIVAVRQYRYAVRQEMTELPAGKLERGEDPREAALRELREEVGATPGKFVSLGTFYSSPGIFSECLHAYLATDLTFGETHPDDDEFLIPLRISIDKMDEMIANGEISDMKTVCTFYKAKQYLKL